MMTHSIIALSMKTISFDQLMYLEVACLCISST